MAKTDGNSQKALGADLVSALYHLDGSGLKIGVISDSFNNQNGAAADVASGDLPAAVTVLRDLPLPPAPEQGGDDEGRAMIELAYKIAPKATYYFASGFPDPGSEDNPVDVCAAAVTALTQAGCDIIIDDLAFAGGEGFYQVGTTLDLAIEAAVASGVNYFSAVGNDNKDFYETGFTPLQAMVPNVGNGVFNDFGGGSPYLEIVIPKSKNASATILLAWAQPSPTIGNSPGAGNSLGLILIDSAGREVASATVSMEDGNPLQALSFKNTTDSDRFRLVVLQNGTHAVPPGQLFKILITGVGSFNDPNASKGSGNAFGHELVTSQNSVGAADYRQTPAFGVAPPAVAYFSSVGPGLIVLDANGRPLATPIVARKPDFVGPQGSNTAVPGFAPFSGTSAAAPNVAAVAALVLQANRALTPAQVTGVLAQSAIPLNTTLADAGAGLVQARAATELAVSEGGDRWNNGAGGNWAAATNWSRAAPPTPAQAASIGNDLGALQAAYTVTIGTPGNTAGSLTVNGFGGAAATLAVTPGGALAVGGSNAGNPTAGDLLVATGGTLAVSGGLLAIAGSLNSNNGTSSITGGTVSADNYAQNAGSLTLTAGLLSLTGGLSETGGSIGISASGALRTTSLASSSSAFTVGAGARVDVGGDASFTSNTVFSDAGTVITAGTLLVDSAIAMILAGGAVTASTIVLMASTSGSTARLDIAGTVTDAGALLTGTDQTFGVGYDVTIRQSGFLSIGGTSAQVQVHLEGGTLDYESSDAGVLTTGLKSVIGGLKDGVSTVRFGALTYDPTYTAEFYGGYLNIKQGSVRRAGLVLSDTPTAFALSADSTNHLQVRAVPCYCPGTLIGTEDGETAIECLSIGDRVRTASGALRPVRWIGRRAFDRRFAAHNRDVLPIRIRADALADGQPRRDLLVSPLHAMAIDGALVPAACLVNGTSITQADTMERIEYIHLELESHDLILAEGAPAETFVDDRSRLMFHNAAEFGALYPGARSQPARYCLPRLEQGQALEDIRARLANRAMRSPPPKTLEGRLDTATSGTVMGWARDGEEPVHLRLVDNGVAIAGFIADSARPDLDAAGIGAHAFTFTIPGGLCPMTAHVIQVQRASDGTELANSPIHLAAERPIIRTASAATAHGQLDHATRDRLTGWAHDPADPATPVRLQVFGNGAPIAHVLANQYRADLAEAGIGGGAHGFDLLIPGGLAPLARHVIDVRRERDGALLPGCPVVIEAVHSFDADLQQLIQGVVRATPAAQAGPVLSFMLGQADQLRIQAARTISDDRSSRRALVIDETVPQHGRDAGSDVVLSHMRALVRLGYAVSFVAASDDGRFAPALSGFHHCAPPHHRGVEDVLRTHAGAFDVVYLHRVGVAARYLELARSYNPEARTIFAVADLHHLRLARQAELENRPELLAHAGAIRTRECMAAWAADAVLTHSTLEAEWLRNAVPSARIHQIGWEAGMTPGPANFRQRSGIAFLGSGGHAPNADAAHWLVEEIMPLVWQSQPRLTCYLAGSALPASVRALERPGVAVLGHVPDLHTLFDRVRLSIAPVRFGAGVKGKVVESLAAGVPCIMTEVAAEGLALDPPLRALVGQDAKHLAALILRHHDRQQPGVRAAGLQLVTSRFAAAAVDHALGLALMGPSADVKAA